MGGKPIANLKNIRTISAINAVSARAGVNDDPVISLTGKDNIAMGFWVDGVIPCTTDQTVATVTPPENIIPAITNYGVTVRGAADTLYVRKLIRPARTI